MLFVSLKPGISTTIHVINFNTTSKKEKCLLSCSSHTRHIIRSSVAWVIGAWGRLQFCHPQKRWCPLSPPFCWPS